jgi:hypoxanthine phosphoribosyltransferase
MKYEVDKVLITEDEILAKAGEIAERINKDYAGEELICLGVLRGAVIWFSDLVKKIKLPVRFDFIRISSYGGRTESSGNVEIHRDTWLDVKGKNVLIVEDIIDSGRTLLNLLHEFKSRGAKSIKTCAMIDKPERREVDYNADYIGFEVPNVFIVGYGMDVDDKFRNLDCIASIKED